MSKIKQIIYEALMYRGFSEEEAIKLLKQVIKDEKQQQPIIDVGLNCDVYV